MDLKKEKNKLEAEFEQYDLIIQKILTEINEIAINNNNHLYIVDINLKDESHLLFFEVLLMAAELFNIIIEVRTNLINYLKIKFKYKKRDKIKIKRNKNLVAGINVDLFLKDIYDSFDDIKSIYIFEDIYNEYYRSQYEKRRIN